MSLVEEDGDEVFIPISYGCFVCKPQWSRGGERLPQPKIVPVNGVYRCERCDGCYGPVQP